MARDVLLVSDSEGVRTLTMNDPRRLNGWTAELLSALETALDAAREDTSVGAVVLTSVDPYYSAGVNLAATVGVQHPRALREMIRSRNQSLFDRFIDFPKPILVAANGPAIGATVTSATLCDAILASERATFSTPFARLAVPAEGCSSVYFARLMGEEAAQRMLGPEGWVPSAEEARKVGLVDEVVPHDALRARAQELAAAWVKEGRTRTLRAGATVDELKAINARESEALADAFLDTPFLMGQFRFLWGKGKRKQAAVFLALVTSRPLWSRLL